MVTETAPKAPAATEKTANGEAAAADELPQSPKRVHFVGKERTSTGSSSNYETSDGVPKRSAAAEAGRGFGTNDTALDETSDAFSNAESASTGSADEPTNVVEYNPADPIAGGEGTDLFPEIDALRIEENSPAAEALRANANVHVSSVGKAARAIHVQAVRKFVKRATGAGKSGVVRGKPPRIPFHVQTEDQLDLTGEEGFEAVVDELEDQEEPTKPKPQPVMPPDDFSGVDQSESADIPDSVVAGTMEAGKKVLGQVDPHDMIKLLRWRRKRNKTKKELKSYVKGKVIDGEHELYTLSIAVMIGVRTSISKTNPIINSGPKRRWVQPEDFRTMEKYEFRPAGGAKTPPHQLAHTFKFKDYAPIAFAYLRRMYGVNEFDFLLSVCGNANFIEFISNAKSGQFFFYSSDGRYMIKTMTNAESKFLRRSLPQYYRHCAENPNTMMTRFFGMYRVKMYHLRRNVKFVIMNSVYYTDKHLQIFYDLKGSVLGRQAKPGQAVKKDNDLRQGMPQDALAITRELRLEVRKQVESDCAILCDMDIMDYSMLVGVHHTPADKDGSIGSSSFRNGRTRASIPGRARASTVEAPSITALLGAPHASADPESPGRDRTASTSLLEKQSSERQPHNESVSGFFFDDGLDDDDSSYLLGSPNRPDVKHPSFSEETERKKQATIEKLYWPFHRLFDIHGHRRMVPAHCIKCAHKPCACGTDPLLKDYTIPEFVAPLSERKDGGYELDTTDLELPLKIKGPQGEQLYDGKIFYMGIIDILQEYTARKAVESKYRRTQTHGTLDASCVPPKDYGDRFLDFFDEYTQRNADQDATVALDIGDFKQASDEGNDS